MTLYLDTSSLIKLYVAEEGSDIVRRLVDDSTIVATSVVAYAETRAALARLRREGALSRANLATAKRAFERQWSSYLALEATDMLCRAAAALAETYALRGFDSIHLASYAEVAHRSTEGDVVFSGFDHRLNDAVRKLKLKLKVRRFRA